MPVIHTFADTREAYDASQIRDQQFCDWEAEDGRIIQPIEDGDILVAESEQVVGYLVKAWPVSVTVAHGAFHSTRKPGHPVIDDEGEVPERYMESFLQAVEIANHNGWAVQGAS